MWRQHRPDDPDLTDPARPGAQRAPRSAGGGDSDVPGALGEICRIIGELDSNIIDLQHQRAFEGSTVRTTGVTFLLQMRGAEAIDPVLARLAAEGYPARRLDGASPAVA